MRQIGPALAAFANTKGGLLVLGVDDQTRAIVGVREDPETVSERLTGFLQSGLSFACSARLGKLESGAGWLHWVEVAHQRWFEPLKYGGRVYVRRGRASVEPTPSELQELLNIFGYIVTEEQAVSASGVDDIEPNAFARYVATLGIDLGADLELPIAADLRIRGALLERAGQLNATLYGLLAFGKNPQGHAQTGSFWIECVAYDGTDRADPVLHVAEARGRIDEQVDRALGWFRASGRSELHDGADRVDRTPVPVSTLREALVNAVCHRDYAMTGSRILLEVFADRVVVTNPGTLPNHMSRESVMAGGPALAQRTTGQLHAGPALHGRPRPRLAPHAARHAPTQRQRTRPARGPRQPLGAGDLVALAQRPICKSVVPPTDPATRP